MRIRIPEYFTGLLTYRFEFIYLARIFMLVGLYAANLPQDRAKLSMSDIFDTALPILHPLIEAGSNRCETLKSFFGLTYQQMLEKNATVEELSIDLITKNGNIKYNLTATSRLKRFLGSDKQIIVLVHGFRESSDGWMVGGVAPELLKVAGLKILALDGRKIINLEYFRSSTYTRFMGEQLGIFLSEIIKDGVDPMKIYLIGHSLGSHIAGIAGKKVQQQTGRLVGRITALDPAGPCFGNVDPSGRISRQDAVYVDVIHTNAGLLGLKEPVGDKDFYPNGGMTQPGCILSTCDHSRAWEFLAESVNSAKHFPARKCENWTSFKEGFCSKNSVSYMGLESKAGDPGLYFFTTAASSPFGLGPTGSG
ncbi:lipase member H-like isoform X1 [Bombyx mandarina]|uniref:Lipase member H-like isoform X1 n=1 Tax=Bombyx mandarina TaxID=7092 RepID=A0A6J2JQH6_BOMMA|nr:lipase member H-like isoform X1 [Bombyx mandarina]